MTSATMTIRVSRFALQMCKRNKGISDGHQRYTIRRNSTQVGSKKLERLNERSILRVSGDETSSFLQGLITNDMKHLEEGASNIYTLFLNTKGRVMYDAIVYKSEESNLYYVECDAQIAESLRKHLKMYRVKRKIDVEHIGDKFNVWSMFDSAERLDDKIAASEDGKRKLEGMIFPCGTLDSKASKFVDNIMIYEDPRLSDLGLRILAESQIGKHEIVKHLDSDVLETAEDYRAFRYKLGIGEGIDDLAPGKAFPLEINCDYLHGVSFHKGCYIGQELTARTYHTGVVRKRLMPLVFDDIVDKPLAYDEKILDESGKAIGKFRGMEELAGTSVDELDNGKQVQQCDSTSQRTAINVGGTFTCSFCSLKERYDYKGAKPPFARQLIYLEECYVMKDPFSPLNRGEVLILGADCDMCGRAVCLGCSIFYTKRICLQCAYSNTQNLPSQLHSKIRNLTKHADS